jgi:hypothetical protein
MHVMMHAVLIHNDAGTAVLYMLPAFTSLCKRQPTIVMMHAGVFAC